MSGTSPLHDRIAAILSETMNVEAPSPHADLFETGAMDSLGFVDLLVRLEQDFGIQVSIEKVEIDNFRTIAKIAEYVSAQNGSAPS